MRHLFLLFVLCSHVLFAQEEKYVSQSAWSNDYHKFDPNEVAYLLADNVNIRDKASSKSNVLVNLPIGTKVKILKESSETLRLNGFKTNWYKVSFAKQNEVTSGYVWGGLIAEGSIHSADKKTLFMYGIASYKRLKEGSYPAQKMVLQVRVCKNKTELSKLEIKSDGSLMHGHVLTNYGSKGLTTVKNIIELGQSGESCGGFNMYSVIFWDGETLHNAAALYPGSDAPAFASDQLIFPSDKGGIKGKIIRDKQEGWYDDENQRDVIERHKMVSYVWTGTALKKVKVLLDKKEQ